MAKQMKKSGLASKLGQAGAKAVEAHRNDETNFGGGGNLPEGIEGGIAQLVDCKFDTYKKGDMVGQYYFYAAGIVKQPSVHNGQHIDGLRTSIMEPMCDTPNRSRKTIDEHLDWVLNEMRKLGADTSDVGLEDLEAVAESLKEEKPHFRFRTWKGEATKEFPNPRVNEQWRGACEFEDDGPVEDVVDETVEADDEVPADEDEAATELDGDAADGGDEEMQQAISEAAEAAGVDPNSFDTWAEVVAAISEAGSEEEEESDEDTSEISVQDMGSMTDDGDEDYTEQLTELAGEYELDPDEYDTWAALGDAIAKARAAANSEEEEEESDEPVAPDKGEVFSYKPPKSKKSLEVVVTAVFPKNKTANVKTLDDGKVFKGIEWGDLS